MDSKLIIDIEEKLALKANLFAEKNGQNLSKLIENYLQFIVNEDNKVTEELSPIVKSLKGSLKKSKSSDYKSDLKNILSEKFNGQ